MEGDGGANNSGCSRWNPTKEQIDMLEGFYRSGIRTPTAQQIQEITTCLRAFGHIEGKNVFYWFQNHKARQRQKQKQDTISYFNRFLHHNTSHVFPPCPNVICSQFCVPYTTDVGLSHHHQQQQTKVLLPRTTSFKRRPPPPPEKLPNYDHDQEYYYYYNVTEAAKHLDMKKRGSNNKQTLDLFPLEPSGNLQARTSSSTSSNGSGALYNIPENDSTTDDNRCNISDGNQQLFFDFFCGNGHGVV